MRVRAAEIADCEPLAEAMTAVAAEGWLATESADAGELAGRYRHSIEDEGHFLFVLEDEGRPVGCLGLNPTMAAGVLALGMWVLPAWRGKGGGRALMEAGLAARPGNVHKFELEVFPDNAAAIGLYLEMGFEREGLRRDHYRRNDGTLRSALIMARLF